MKAQLHPAQPVEPPEDEVTITMTKSQAGILRDFIGGAISTCHVDGLAVLDPLHQAITKAIGHRLS